MKFNKLSFIFLTLALVVLISVGVSANVTTRSLPTIYKVTGDINIEEPGNSTYLVVASVNTNGQDYAVGLSGCKAYDNIKSDLATGIFIGPIPYELVGHTSKSFNLKLSVHKYYISSACSSNGITLNEAVLYNPDEGTYN